MRSEDRNHNCSFLFEEIELFKAKIQIRTFKPQRKSFIFKYTTKNINI